MSEDEILHQILILKGSHQGVTLAGYWLMMGSAHVPMRFTIDDVRELDGNGRAIFHCISAGVASRHLGRLSEETIVQLFQIMLAHESGATRGVCKLFDQLVTQPVSPANQHGVPTHFHRRC